MSIAGVSWRLRVLVAVVVAALAAAIAVAGAGAGDAVGAEFRTPNVGPSGTTAPVTSSSGAMRPYDPPGQRSGPRTYSITGRLATKAGRSADNLPPIRGGAPGAGGRASKLSPNDDALGPHTVFRRGQDGRIDKYTRFDDFGNETLRFRGSGGSHAGLDPPLFYGAKPGKGPGAPLNRARNPGPDDYQNLPPGY